MANKCNVILTVSGPPDILEKFCFATISPESYRPTTISDFYFSLAALVPCRPEEDSYEVWGCRGDVCDNLNLESMGWHPGCNSIDFFFQTNNAPPLYWFYKVIEMFPLLEFDICSDIFTLGCHTAVHAINGIITSEKFESNVDYFQESDHEAELELYYYVYSRSDYEPDYDLDYDADSEPNYEISCEDCDPF